MALTAQEWTVSGLSVELGLDRRTLGKHLKGVKPIREAGKSKYYYMAQVVQVLRGSSEAGSYEEERTRLTKAQADHEELKVSEYRGDLIPSGVVSQLWGDMVGAMRARLLALPPRLASKAIAATGLREIEDFARTEVYAALTELADHAEDSADIPADLETDSAAAQING